MNESHPISVACLNGHSLRASERSIGQTLRCPVCREAVSVTQPKVSLSDTGVMRILGERIQTVAAQQQQQPIPSSEKTDELSDTGVMRILGDFVATPNPLLEPEEPKLRSCPVCSCGVRETVSVCQNCRCYVGTSPDYLKDLES